MVAARGILTTMATLALPDVRFRRSFVAAMDEFRAEGRGAADDDSMVGTEIRMSSGDWGTDEAFARFTDRLRAAALEETPRPEGWVPSTTYWWVDGDEYLGRIAIRHSLPPHMLEYGGHIGYDVRSSARRQGHATAMLRAALPLAAELGIEDALITCDVDNVASRRVIEECGGRFEDERVGKLRYWVATS